MYSTRFIANTKDDLHCLQASYAMALGAFFGTEVTMDQAEIETGFVEGRQTWPFLAMTSLVKKGLQVRNIERFDVQLFIEDPAAAVKQQANDDDVAAAIMNETDTSVEPARASECLRLGVVFEDRIPSIEDVVTTLKNGSLAIVNLNAKALLGLEGYSGHFVLVREVRADRVVLRNPGLPPVDDQEVDIPTFVRAWKPDASPEMANIIEISHAD